MKKPKANIYLADPLCTADIRYLRSRNFRIHTLKFTTNKQLLSAVSSLDKKTSLDSVLVIRSIRSISRSDVFLLKKKSNIRLICTLSSGYDNIDMSACNEAGIDVINIPDGNYISAAEHTFAMMLALSKNLISHDSFVRNNSGNSLSKVNFELSGKTIGIVGVGKVGSAVARFANAFSMQVLGFDIDQSLREKYFFVKFVPMDYLLKNSDIITLHVPLDKSTYKLIGESSFKLMKRNSFIVNCSRGKVIDEKSLINALRSGKIKGAALDVFENEPEINPKLLELKNTVFTPHIAGKTKESKIRISKSASRRIYYYFTGGVKPVNSV